MEEDTVIDHAHDVLDPGHVHDYTDSWQEGGHGYHISGGSDNAPAAHHKTTSSSTSGISVKGVSAEYKSGNETRPKNMNVVYIIRVY